MVILILQVPAYSQSFKAVPIDEYNELIMYRSMYLKERKEKIEIMQFADSLHKIAYYQQNKIKALEAEIFRMDHQVLKLQEMLSKENESLKSKAIYWENKWQKENSQKVKMQNIYRKQNSDRHKVVDAVSYSANLLLLLGLIAAVNH